MKYLYKYPQAAYPVRGPGRDERRRGATSSSTSCSTPGSSTTTATSTSFVEYAKASPEDILVRITVHNRGPERRSSTCCRHSGSATPGPGTASAAARRSTARPAAAAPAVQATRPPALGDALPLLRGRRPSCCSPRTRPTPSGSSGVPNATPYVKDGINECIVHGRAGAVNPAAGTKAAAHYALDRRPARRRSVSGCRRRACGVTPTRQPRPFGASFDGRLRRAQREADEFYASVIPPIARRRRRRTSCARRWPGCCGPSSTTTTTSTAGSTSAAPTRSRRSRKRAPRNGDWHHMYNADIISMPDKWEYPWYAAWDLAFHVHRRSRWSTRTSPSSSST